MSNSSDIIFLPFDTDAHERDDQQYALTATAPFKYLGQALTIAEFATYIVGCSFGTILPSFVILHHTAIPSTSWARYGSGAVWDANEQGLTIEQVRAKRLGHLAQIRDYYRDSLGWDRGPHLFIDDRFIYLFTPMRDVGIHAKEGNSYSRNGKLYYSIGIEVIGYYEHVVWPEAVAHNVGRAVALLKRRLGTFEIAYGKGAGFISSHRDYNKPQCPGAAITESLYLKVIRDAWAELNAPPAPSVPPETLPPGCYPVDARLQGAWSASGGIWAPGRLTPGYAVSPLERTTQGWRQRFERGICTIDHAGAIQWMLLSEIAHLEAR